MSDYQQTGLTRLGSYSSRLKEAKIAPGPTQEEPEREEKCPCACQAK